MPRTRQPRAGSMQFWPRVRARYVYARIRNWPASKEAKPLGFAGYKVGMTHLMINDNRPNSLTKGTDIFYPTTIIECPPLKTASIRFYKNTQDGTRIVLQKALQVAGTKPAKIITDGLKQYCYAIKKVIGWNWRIQKEKHIVSSGIGKKLVYREIKLRNKKKS